MSDFDLVLRGNIVLTDRVIEDGYVDTWFVGSQPFSALGYATDLLGRVDWTQVGIGVVFSIVLMYLGSEYRRRSNDN